MLYALGLGNATPAVEPGIPAPGIAQVEAFRISIGGVEADAADVLYAGVSPSYLGLYQINLRIPAEAKPGDQPVVIRVGAASSPAGAYLTIAQ